VIARSPTNVAMEMTAAWTSSTPPMAAAAAIPMVPNHACIAATRISIPASIAANTSAIITLKERLNVGGSADVSRHAASMNQPPDTAAAKPAAATGAAVARNAR
jgi:hypothetical protein